MAILIKTLDLPKNCVECNFSNGYCRASNRKFDRNIKLDVGRMQFCPLTALPTIEELMEPMCDRCQWPGWYKDPDDLFREKCSDCPVERKLAEVLYGET